MVASAENVLKSTENNSKSCENNSKSCEKPLNGRHDTVFLHTYLTEVRMLAPHALKGQKLLAQDCYGPQAARPERAEALSPGQRPGYNGNWQGAL